MNPALWVSKTGLAAQDAKMAAISNNLANVNTTGFKRDRVAFEDLYYQTQRVPGAMLDQNNAAPGGIQYGSGDLAYTRSGNFRVNADGVLTNSQGLPLIPQIELPENVQKLTIGRDGTVSATVGGEAEPVELGQLTLVTFVNPAGLEALGDNLYRETTASGEANEGVPGEDGFGSLLQGSLEGSNVQVVEEMVDMITVQRAYEMNAKMVSAADDMLRFLTQQM
ncbi:flagellar basal body rod protein FlgG [Izhakiella australiensis]|uniref:Flagellar basal body rod protein FlgG n=1 Tax=Izhakiella australiensis TaxID=1926881 RepID=A0A1S8YIP0_9GAMM|nr:flagellar hook-basal body complex protein [Izhakiella australiensis]OON38758.1 flagellar basal body rod protein FlgG [Izhakiella australiensis]